MSLFWEQKQWSRFRGKEDSQPLKQSNTRHSIIPQAKSTMEEFYVPKYAWESSLSIVNHWLQGKKLHQLQSRSENSSSTSPSQNLHPLNCWKTELWFLPRTRGIQKRKTGTRVCPSVQRWPSLISWSQGHGIDSGLRFPSQGQVRFSLSSSTTSLWSLCFSVKYVHVHHLKRNKNKTRVQGFKTVLWA